MTRRLALLLLAGLLAACGGVGPGPTPSPSTPTPSPGQTPGAGFALRAWYSQALPPDATFGSLSMLTVVDGTVIDGNVAVPAIYPGPLVILPNARSISPAGIAAIIDEARAFGLLGDVSDFTGGAMPGEQLGHIELVVDGVRRELTGDPGRVVRCDAGVRCTAEPGTPEAFAAFWQMLSFLDGWLAAALGPAVPYIPERLAVLAVPPVETTDIQPGRVGWPLDDPFDTFGQPFGARQDSRCATIADEDLDTLLPVARAANQLTRFVDADGAERSLIVRALVPGEPSPCPAPGA